MGILFISQPSFGRLPQGERLERVRKSPHYDGTQFVNEVETAFSTGNRTKLGVWKDYVFGDKTLLFPDTALHVIKTDLKSLPQDRDWIVWFGHSSYLMNLSGKKVLVDPVFYKGSPVEFANKMFLGTDVYKPADMPDIDYLVVSHDHWDHLDYEVVTEMKPRVKKVVTALGVGEHFEYWGYPVEKIVELDWWEFADLEEGFRVTATPARHFSGRELHENKTFWASFAFKSPKRLVWIGGDSGYGPHYAKIGKEFPDIDLAIMENGQYNKDWSQVHTMPEYLGKEMIELDAKRYLTVHHSKFSLSKHPYYEPLENAKRAARESGKPVLMPQIGEVMYLE
ncbi:MBL fold metallo-hydrolase [Fibrobacter sp.]|uniref:MBL fold metallo-hydrolase n=1 Tax=Fibrobacter sp. TaxID=35828 RepID=UPI0025BB2475|nr:MBL fold metallo-hydrolase [Fibrobacter sp.]